MKIALDISPLSTGHSVRGTGFYVEHLKNAFEKFFPDNAYTYFTDAKKIPDNVDVIHYPYFDPFFLTLPFFSKKKTVVTVHDLTPLVFPESFPAGIKGKIKWMLQKRSLKREGAIITDSETSKQDIARIVGYPSKNIHVVSLAAGEKFQEVSNKEFLKVVKEKYGLPNAFALYVGDVTWNKNLPRLVKAALRANMPLVMVGKALLNKKYDRKNPWNKDLVEVQSLAEKNTHLISRLGFVSSEELVALYNLASLAVMPSLYEGFGLPILEAMACGCPVVTSDRGAMKEVAADAGFLVDPKSVDAIAHAMQRLVGDSLLAKSLKAKGLQRAKLFSWEKTATETFSVYKLLLEK